jgi:hypothetical protein
VAAALARGDTVEACSLYRRLLDHTEDGTARDFLAANGCEGLLPAAAEDAAPEGRPDTPGEPAFQVQVAALEARLRAALGGDPDTTAGTPPADPAEPADRVSGELLDTIVTGQVRAAREAASVGPRVSAALYEIPPDLKEQLKGLRDKLPEWVRELDDPAPGAPAAAREGRPPRTPGEYELRPVTGDPEPAPQDGALRALAELGSNVFGAFGWLAGVVRENQAATLSVALLGAGLLSVQHYWTKRRRRRVRRRR